MQPIQFFRAMRPEVLHRLMVHARRPLVADHVTAGGK
jgi:hypothetical protein